MKAKLADLNQSNGEVFAISPEVRQILELARTLHQKTNGAFDITSSPLSQAWGFHQRQGAVPSQQQIDEAKKSVDAAKIELDDQGARLAAGNLKINLNSIGKGYALDHAASLIRGFQIHDFIIHGGQSSVIARGNESKGASMLESDSGNGWTVGLSHPYVPKKRLLEIALDNECLATSGTARQGFYHQGRRYGHILDPRTGWPTDHFLSATVISPSAAICDALATAFFVMSLEEIQDYVQAHQEISAIIVVPESNSGPVSIETFNVSDEAIKRY